MNTFKQLFFLCLSLLIKHGSSFAGYKYPFSSHPVVFSDLSKTHQILASVKQDKENVVVEELSSSDVGSSAVEVDEECVVPEELSDTEKLLKQVKEAGTAGVVSYALWELGFWTLSVPVCVFGYREVTGHWPDFTDKDDVSKLGAEAFAFVNFARFAVPLRIGLALSTTPWIQENIIDRFKKEEPPVCEEPNDMGDGP